MGGDEYLPQSIALFLGAIGTLFFLQVLGSLKSGQFRDFEGHASRMTEPFRFYLLCAVHGFLSALALAVAVIAAFD